MVFPVMYLTVELKHRELESRLLIALHALKAGFSVVVGQQWAIFANAAVLPPGAVLYKTVNDIQARSMPLFRKAGFVIAATDEEVLLCTEPACFLCATSKIAVDNWHVFFAQSEIQKASIEGRFPGTATKIAVVGNSRIDLMRAGGLAVHRPEADKLRAEHGPYILFNTNFAGINSIWGSVKNVADINIRAGGDDASFQTLVKWEQRNCDELTALLAWTADNIKTHRVIIRPHPGERLDLWSEKFGQHPNITIIPRSNHIPWIIGSDLVVHSNCTTGLEAAIAEVPVLNLVPSPEPLWRTRMTDFVNPSFRSWQEAADAISLFINHQKGVLTQRATTEQHLSTYFVNYRTSDASLKIAEKIGHLLLEQGAHPDPEYRWNILPGQKYIAYQRAQPLREKMTVSLAEVMSSLERLVSITGVKRNIELAQIEDSLFLLRPN
jgi:surface carbohydrate biosynthesis protein